MHKVGRVNLNCRARGVSFGPDGIAAAAGRGRALQERLSELVRSLLPDLLPALLKAHCGRAASERGTGAYCVYERLNLPLGEIRLSELENVLKSRLAEQISRELSARQPAVMDEAGRLPRLLEEYLRTGSLPWNGLDLEAGSWAARLPRLLARLGAAGGNDASRLRARLADPLHKRRLLALIGWLGLSEEIIPQTLCREAPDEPGFAPAAPAEALSGTGMGPGEEKRYFVNNAGLVLLAPFLGHYFRRLNLVDESGRFKASDCRAGAVAALQAACDPESEGRCFHEGELALNKLLCGWPPDRPLEAARLPPPERGEVAALIAAVTDQWSALGEMAPGGFAASFLRRQGTLRLDGVYRLHVERLPQDLPLARLPWALSIISTAWMERPLEVFWEC